jgi:polyisoprenoid-binding protein YceI
MKRILLVLVAVAVLAGGAVAAWFFTQGDAEPTTGATTPTLATTTTTVRSETTTTAVGSGTTAATTGGTVLLELTEESTATFTLGEVLRGEPKTVVGTATIVIGQVEIAVDDLAGSRIGEILVNARTFATDSSFRDRAVRGPILDTDAFEFISFTPTAIEGLSGAAAVGEPLTFTVAGDLRIRDVTAPVVFEVTATLAAEGRLEGSATTEVLRSTFGLEIPSVASVADVTDEVTITLDFVAEAT